MSAASEGRRSAAEIKPLAILAPTFQVAESLARELGLTGRTWFHVNSVRSVLGLESGRYAIRIGIGTQLTRDQDQALDYMIGRGWKPQ